MTGLEPVWEARALWGLVRAAFGVLTRGVFWLSLAMIVGNAVAESVRAEDWFALVLRVLLFPIVFVTWPFSRPEYALAWPWPDGTTLLPVLAAGLIGYLLSVTAGARPAIPTWGSNDG